MTHAAADRPGALAIVLHSHMPYVEGHGTWPFGEEWLWEAVACVYLPLLDLLDGMPVTVGLTPVLCDQFDAMRGDAGERFVRFLREVRAPIHAEDSAGLDATGEPALAAEVRRAAGDYTRAEAAFERRGRDLVAAFAALKGVELWTSAATHGLLPLMATDAGLRLQVGTGTTAHAERFGDWGGGFWLPECAYVPGLERELSEHGVRSFCVDQTEVPGFDHLTPVLTGAGAVAVPVDWATVQLVWNEVDGYPASGGYRNYWGRTVHDLKPWSNAGLPYEHDAALALAREHARDFVSRAARAAQRRRPPLLRARHGAARPLVVRGRRLARRRVRGGRQAGRAARDRLGGHRAGGAGGAAARRRRPGGAGRTSRPGTPRPWPSSPSRPARRSCAPSRRSRRTAPRTAGSSARPASCSRSRRATGPSWSRATWRPTIRPSACARTEPPSTPRLPL